MKRLLTLLAIILCLRLTLSAQEEFVAPPSRHITTIPFKMFMGGIILLRAQVANFPDTLNFVLDTGSGGISLDSLTCDYLKIKPEPSDKTIRGIAGIKNVSFANNLSLRLPGLVIDSLNFHINDYEVLTSVYGEKIDGIIGYSFLSRYIVQIDYDSLKLHVYTKGTFKYPKGGFLYRPLITNLPIQNAKIRDEKVVDGRFYFDTGAGLCLLLSSDFISDSALFSSRKKMVNTQAEGLGGKASMKLTTVKEMRLGPYKFKNVPAYIFDDIYNVTSYPYLGGLIGNDILRRFNVILNYSKRDFYLIPNSHFREPFDYSYTGLGIYVIEGEIRVMDIMKGSPAEKAGFKEGDIIIAVQNNFSRNIQHYKNALQVVGEKIKVTVMRPGGPEILVIQPKSIKSRR